MRKPPLADRMKDIQPFHVMDILARARALEAQGRSIIHMEIGEPDFPTPPSIVAAGIEALQSGYTHYTPALGLPALRAAIATSYPESWRPAPDRVVVTPGASGALQLVFGVLINPGDEVLIADPAYPCNRNLIRLLDGVARLIPVGADSNYQLTAELIAHHWSPRTRAVLLASPSNPTGTLIAPDEMARIIDWVNARNGHVIVDEIYHGLTYDVDVASALSFSDQVFVVNSFSKFYGMTGWRVGWLVAPSAYVPAIDRLAQNMFLATSTPAQYAALAALASSLQPELQRRRRVFQERRDHLLPALKRLGFAIPCVPRGAFYVYADCSALARDSQAFSSGLLERAGVAITPGLDFGSHRAQVHVRFSYATSLESIEEAMRRIETYLSERSPV